MITSLQPAGAAATVLINGLGFLQSHSELSAALENIHVLLSVLAEASPVHAMAERLWKTFVDMLKKDGWDLECMLPGEARRDAPQNTPTNWPGAISSRPGDWWGNRPVLMTGKALPKPRSTATDVSIDYHGIADDVIHANGGGCPQYRRAEHGGTVDFTERHQIGPEGNSNSNGNGMLSSESLDLPVTNTTSAPYQIFATEHNHLVPSTGPPTNDTERDDMMPLRYAKDLEVPDSSLNFLAFDWSCGDRYN